MLRQLPVGTKFRVAEMFCSKAAFAHEVTVLIFVFIPLDHWRPEGGSTLNSSDVASVSALLLVVSLEFDYAAREIRRTHTWRAWEGQ
jgi:hypothetical protein